MKKLDSKTLQYIAHAYGRKNFAGDASDPSASEVESLDETPADEAVASNPTATPPNSANPSPPPGFDGSPEANPNVPISSDAMASAGVTPDDLNNPASGDTAT